MEQGQPCFLSYRNWNGGIFLAVEFCTLASGSSGNSTYVGTKHTRILIDAGVSGKRIQEGLAELKLTGDDIDGLFITHEHLDHIKGAGIFSRRFDVPIYATCETWGAMEETLGKISPGNKRFVYAGENCVINDICVRPLHIPHDAADPVGFNVFAGGKKVTLATDIGHITDEIRESITESEILLLEANHDEEMVQKGSYPWHLKKRILSDRGHLSNKTAGELLSAAVDGKMKHVFLGHLSQENNEPHLAFDTVEKILQKNRIQIGKHFNMDMAYRHTTGFKVEL